MIADCALAHAMRDHTHCRTSRRARCEPYWRDSCYRARLASVLPKTPTDARSGSCQVQQSVGVGRWRIQVIKWDQTSTVPLPGDLLRTCHLRVPDPHWPAGSHSRSVVGVVLVSTPSLERANDLPGDRPAVQRRSGGNDRRRHQTTDEPILHGRRQEIVRDGERTSGPATSRSARDHEDRHRRRRRCRELRGAVDNDA